MRPEIEARFEDLAERLISDATAIGCSIGEFYAGLKIIADAIAERRSLAKSDGVMEEEF